MSTLLGVSVGYLFGETIETDPVLTESLATWNAWIENTPDLRAAVANRVKRDWQEDYSRTRKQPLAASFRNTNGAMRETDRDKLYQEALKKEKGTVVSRRDSSESGSSTPVVQLFVGRSGLPSVSPGEVLAHHVEQLRRRIAAPAPAQTRTWPPGTSSRRPWRPA